jgi:tRNA pseudouridine(38-40) synthase
MLLRSLTDVALTAACIRVITCSLRTRAARTDRGVHAVANVVALKVAVDAPAEGEEEDVAAQNELIRTSVNAHLPEAIRILKVVRVAGG